MTADCFTELLTGTTGKLPYKNLDMFEMVGMPQNISLKNPSHYGKETCESILRCKGILKLEYANER